MCDSEKASNTASPQRPMDGGIGPKSWRGEAGAKRLHREGEETRIIPAGTIVKMAGLSFRLEYDTMVSADRHNFVMAAVDHVFRPVGE